MAFRTRRQFEIKSNLNVCDNEDELFFLKLMYKMFQSCAPTLLETVGLRVSNRNLGDFTYLFLTALKFVNGLQLGTFQLLMPAVGILVY
jgi:hypothetical protein